MPEFWQEAIPGPVKLSYLISTSDPEEAAQLASKAKAEGYKGLDVKVGLTPKRDIDVIRAVKEAAPDLFFRVDANQAYTLSQAIQLAKNMEAVGVDVFEQPLPAGDLLGHARLRARAGVPIALDEAWVPPGRRECRPYRSSRYDRHQNVQNGGPVLRPPLWSNRPGSWSGFTRRRVD